MAEIFHTNSGRVAAAPLSHSAALVRVTRPATQPLSQSEWLSGWFSHLARVAEVAGVDDKLPSTGGGLAVWESVDTYAT